MKTYSQVPQELKDEKRWVVYKNRDRKGKTTKIPFMPGYERKAAASDDPKTWSTYDEVIEEVENHKRYDGIGFMLGAGWIGIDVDGIYEKDDEDKPIPEVLEPFKDTAYIEISPSGTGIHAIFRSKSFPVPPNMDPKKDTGGKKDGVEIYFARRYFTVTGTMVSTPEDPFSTFEEQNKDPLVEALKKVKPEWWEKKTVQTGKGKKKKKKNKKKQKPDP